MARFDGAGRYVALALLAATVSARSLATAAIHNTRDTPPVLVGCFSTPDPLVSQGSYKYQSSGHCSGICTSLNDGVVGLSDGDVCWCGSELPPLKSKVLDSKCNTPCQGYGLETCGGGTFYFTVWLTGQQANVPYYDPSSNTSSPTSSSSAVPQSTTSASSTSTGAAAPTSTPTAAPSKTYHPTDKKLGIILGVCISAVALAVMGILLCCLFRRRKRTGSFRRQRSMPLLSRSSTLSSSGSVPEATVSIAAGSRKWEGRVSRVSVTPKRSSQPAMGMNTRDHHLSGQPSWGGSSIYTPREGMSTTNLNRSEPDLPDLPRGSEGYSGSTMAHNAPTTDSQDFAHPLPTSVPPPTIMQKQDLGMHQQQYDKPPQNPFASPQDEEEEMADVVSPITPAAQKVDRIRSFPGPMVHYPSWSEVSDFDFSGNGAGNRSARKVVSVDGAAGWHPWRERKDGRHELA